MIIPRCANLHEREANAFPGRFRLCVCACVWERERERSVLEEIGRRSECIYAPLSVLDELR